MRHLVLLLTAVGFSSCVTTRSIYPSAYQPLESPPRALGWRLAAVSVTAPSTSAKGATGAVSSQKMLDVVAAHVRQALSDEPSLGRPVTMAADSAYSLEVTVHLQESARAGAWLAPAVTGAIALPITGMLVGAAVGGPVGLIVGSAIGLGASSPMLGVPTHCADGALVADAIIRSPDGMELASLSERVEWVVPGTRRDALFEAIGHASGEALPELERKLAMAVRRTLDARGLP